MTPNKPQYEGDERRSGEDRRSETGAVLARMVDFKLPLYWILSGLGVLLWALVSMWFSLQQIKEDMTQLKAATVVAAATTSELALLKYRLSLMEGELAQYKAARNAK